MKAKKIIYFVAVGILLVIFLVSGFYVVDYFVNSANQKSKFDDLADIVDSVQKGEDGNGNAGQDPSVPDATQETEEATILPEYQPLYDMNQDIVGWLKIEGTNVNYPVMQTPDSVDYYLYRNFQKEYSIQGSLYVRESCDVNLPSDNVTIYGHNMVDGSMFHDLLDYQEEDFWKEHDTIIFDTLTGHHTYKIFAVFKTTASVGEGFKYHQFEYAANEQEFNNFIKTCKTLSFFDTGITPVYGDKIICLSTCEYTLTNGRFVVAAYRIS